MTMLRKLTVTRNEVWLDYAIAIQKNQVVAVSFFNRQVQNGCFAKAMVRLPKVDYWDWVIFLEGVNQ
jgi:IS1 family transposase